MFRRTLREFTDSERATLRLSHILETLGIVSAREREMLTIPLVWNEGNCVLIPGGNAFHGADRRAKLRSSIDDIVTGYFGKKAAAIERVEAALRVAFAPGSVVTSEDRAVLERYLFSGARWLSPDDDYSNLHPDGSSPSALKFGRFYGTDREMFYDMRESVFTLAAPGTGKSLPLLMRNLLSNRSGAVVLDVKGELYAATAAWRAANVGPVYRYDPTEPEESVSFNPLDWIRTDRDGDFAFEDATTLARFLTFTPKRMDYWESAGVRAVATALAKTALNPGRAGRTVADAVGALNDIAAGPSAEEGASLADVLGRASDDVKQWLDVLYASGQPLLYDEGRTFLMMPGKQRGGVLEVARTQLVTWQAGNTFRLSQSTTVRGRDLRGNPGNGPATLYITVPLDKLDTYRSTIRALLGCLYRDLISGHADPRAPIVTFYIDEMPQLQRIDIFEKGLATGRGYGLRFWFFTQTMAQLRDAYETAAPGLLDMCGARLYMNPTPEDARMISDLLSEREGLLDSRRKPLVDPADLYGPEFRNNIIAITRANFPARLTKVFPNDDTEFSNRLK